MEIELANVSMKCGDTLEMNFSGSSNGPTVFHSAVLYEDRPYPLWQQAVDWFLQLLGRPVKFSPVIAIINLKGSDHE